MATAATATAGSRATALLLLLLSLALRASGAGAGAGGDCHFPAVFNFGDSNSDTGGLSSLFGAAPPPNGRTFFGMPTGRYCDGRLVIDFIAESLGLTHLSAYLNSIGSNFTQGANFATAGSSIRRQNTSLFLSGFSPISLDVQFWEFEQFINRSQLVYNNKGGIYREILPRAEYFSQALYTFDIGQNDITSSYFVNNSTEEVEAIIPDLMERLTSIIQSVYSRGGRYFWIHNTGPLGCLPYALLHRPDLTTPADGTGCSVTYNKVAQLFNLRLKETVASLRKTHPDAAFTYVDVYTAKYKLISQAKKLGFDDPLLTCCGHGGGRYNLDLNIGCGGKKQVNGTSVVVGKSCEDPSKRVSWDGVHFTEAANKFVFDQIVAGALSDPPVALRQACHSRGQ
ncbi:GDSL esterase/lipase ACHE-like [Miscanthus floridulus]|uniref:GDSL esterase/lipase ACHE-like n=1 Tax=Miscanthus floridulus TaxID=154761 RepID=UPI00345908FC